MQAIFHGHSFVQIKTDTKNILIDPFVEGNSQCDITVDELLEQDIDAVLLTHGHNDHLGCTDQLSKKLGCPIVCSYELGRYLEVEEGLENVSTLGIGGAAQYDGFGVKLFQARHGGGITDFTHGYTTVAAGIVITIDGYTIYHAGDTGLFGDMKLLDEFYDIDVAFVPIGDRFTMGVQDAIIATSRIKPKYVVPIHYNTRDLIKADDMTFAREVLLGNHAVPKVLRPGQAVVMEK